MTRLQPSVSVLPETGHDTRLEVAPVAPIAPMRSSIFSQLKHRITLKAKEIPLPTMLRLLNAEKGWQSLPATATGQSQDSSHPLMYLNHFHSWHCYLLNLNLLL